jgi:hypothetical protein
VHDPYNWDLDVLEELSVLAQEYSNALDQVPGMLREMALARIEYHSNWVKRIKVADVRAVGMSLFELEDEVGREKRRGERWD